MYLDKIRRVLKSGRPFYRAHLSLNRTPLRHLVKIGVKAYHPQLTFKRKKLRGLDFEELHQKHARELREKGYTVLGNVFDSRLLSRLEAHVREQAGRVENIKGKQTNETKPFWVRLSDDDSQNSLDTENVLVQTAIDETILKIVTQYFKEIPYLTYVLTTLSGPSESLRGSQLWHVDRDDVKMCKLFVYLSDVDDLCSGPFTFFDSKQSARIQDAFIAKHMTDNEVAKFVKLSDATQMFGKKLSVFMVDTSRCYHMGSRVAPGHFRVMYTALFTTLPSIYYGSAKNGVQILEESGLSEFQKQVVDPFKI